MEINRFMRFILILVSPSARTNSVNNHLSVREGLATSWFDACKQRLITLLPGRQVIKIGKRMCPAGCKRLCEFVYDIYRYRDSRPLNLINKKASCYPEIAKGLHGIKTCLVDWRSEFAHYCRMPLAGLHNTSCMLSVCMLRDRA